MKKIALFLMMCISILTHGQDTLKVEGLGNAKLLPVLWHQYAAEYRALCYQAFNIARWRLEDLKLKKRKKYAIITDVDETVLDNSYYEADRLLQGKDFESTSWKEWTGKSKATGVPGALEFLQLARKKGIEIFYVSNRDTSEVVPTIGNLKALGFPDADEQHLLFLATTSSKEERRQKILQDYKVVMMLGDNLNDFAQVFEKKKTSIRTVEVDRFMNDWGNRFIVLPNCIYGEWENALLDYTKNLSPPEREIRMKEKLITSPH
jgi:5'-nucleotidase (lipoprotein e(P4) family)